jgi:hypothetical protein
MRNSMWFAGLVGAFAALLLGSAASGTQSPIARPPAKVVRIVVYHLPDYMESFGAQTPENLEQGYTSSMTIRGEDPRLKAIVHAIDAVTFVRTPEHADVRWGIVFFDEKNKRLKSIFVDRFGFSGYVNGSLVRFRVDNRQPATTDLLGILRSQFGCLRDPRE